VAEHTFAKAGEIRYLYVEVLAAHELNQLLVVLIAQMVGH
jgi:hypothetical protein